MEKILIETQSKSYDVIVGKGAIAEIKPFLSKYFPQLTKLMIITDETVAGLHLEKLREALSGFNPIVFKAPSGEKAKTFDVYYQALTAGLENHLDRKSLILTFGGGAVGDLGGFVAATFMRGVPFIQIPTTILAHDSAVGGKVAINHPSGKNMIGAFYQPEAVFYDLNLLGTLPPHEIRSGFAEVIKHALIHDPEFYRWLLDTIHSFGSLTTEQLQYALVKGIKVKREFVSRDERETGVRAFLNFGHTLGHAIEAEMGYGTYTHGEAVMVGMAFALQLSKELLEMPFNLEEFTEWATRLGYSLDIPSGGSKEKLIERMHQDKKSVGNSIHFVLLEQVGKPVLRKISDKKILEQLDKF